MFMNTQEKQITEFCRQYLAAALWSSNNGNVPFDDGFTIYDFAPEAIEKAEADCMKFMADCGNFFDLGQSLSQVAHDLWLTRNHHGSGFWDGDYEDEIGEELTKYCHKMGEQNVVLGDDGKLYLE